MFIKQYSKTVPWLSHIHKDETNCGLFTVNTLLHYLKHNDLFKLMYNKTSVWVQLWCYVFNIYICFQNLSLHKLNRSYPYNNRNQSHTILSLWKHFHVQTEITKLIIGETFRCIIDSVPGQLNSAQRICLTFKIKPVYWTLLNNEEWSFSEK